MDEANQKKVELYSQQIDRLKGVKHEQEVLISTMATAQLELEEAGEQDFADAVTQIFSETAKNHEALIEIITKYELEINRIRNEDP